MAIMIKYNFSKSQMNLPGSRLIIRNTVSGSVSELTLAEMQACSFSSSPHNSPTHIEYRWPNTHVLNTYFDYREELKFFQN